MIQVLWLLLLTLPLAVSLVPSLKQSLLLLSVFPILEFVFRKVARYTGIGNYVTRAALLIIRYFPTEAFNFAFKDRFKTLFPRNDENKEFFMFFLTNMASGGLAGA